MFNFKIHEKFQIRKIYMQKRSKILFQIKHTKKANGVYLMYVLNATSTIETSKTNQDEQFVFVTESVTRVSSQ